MKRFNLRVYAIIINDQDQILVADERRYGRSFTKFPGGGLEWGEGFVECIKREIREELKVDCEVGELFYLTDFFQQSAFNENDQLVSLYYNVRVPDTDSIILVDHEVPLPYEGEAFRWLELSEISEEDFTFPVDKRVAEKLRSLQPK